MLCLVFLGCALLTSRFCWFSLLCSVVLLLLLVFGVVICVGAFSVCGLVLVNSVG